MKLTTFKLPKHNLSNKIITLLGPRGSGKSWAIRSILKKLSEDEGVPTFTAYSKTEGKNHFFAEYISDSFVFDEFNANGLKQFVTRQGDLAHNVNQAEQIGKKLIMEHGTKEEINKYNKLFDKNKSSYEVEIRKTFLKMGKRYIDKYWHSLSSEEKEQTKYLMTDPRAVLIFDDVLSDNTWKKNEDVKDIFFNGRHSYITFILAMQFPLGIDPNLRTNIDYVFIYRDNENTKRIFDNYAGIFGSKKNFEKAMKGGTTNHRCLVIKRIGGGDNLEDSCWIFKAKNIESFKADHPLVQAEHDICYDPNWKKNSISTNKGLSLDI